MKKIIIVLLIAAGCNQRQPTPVENKTAAPAKNSVVNKLALLNLASAKDLSCGMPISAGLSDTASYKGKLYGFCSPECKADFLKNAKALLKAK